MANTQEKPKPKETQVKSLGVSQTDIKKQLEEQVKITAELQDKLKELEEAEALKAAEALKRNAEETAKQKLYDLAFKAGFRLPGTAEETGVEVPQTEDKYKVDTFRGIWFTLGIFALLVGVFFLYISFATLNGSEIRISDAAFSHIMSHLPIALVSVMFGLLIQYLLFNQQFRYLCTNINSRNSFQEDFKIATIPAAIRMCVALFTWAFPVWAVTSLMLLILG